MSLGALALAAALLVAAAWVPLHAQSVTFTPNDTQPRPGWTLTPSFVFAQASDSNITLAGEGNPALSDSVASLSPSADISFLGRMTTFNGGYSGSANRYFTVNTLDTYDQRLYGNLKQQIGRRVQAFGRGSASWAPTTDTIHLTGVPFARIGSQIQDLDGGVTIALTKTTETTAGYRYEWVQFDRSSPLAALLLGGHTSGVYGNVRHQLTEQISIGGSYDIRRAIVADGAQQFDMLNTEGTVEYKMSPSLVLSGGLGLARLAGSLPGQGSRMGPAYHGAANYKINRVSAYANYQRSFVPSYGIGGTVQNQELDLGGSLPVAFRDRLVVGANYSRRRSDPLLTVFPLKAVWLNVFGGYSFAPWLRVEGFYARDRQDSPLATVLRDRVGVQVVTFAPVRFK